MEDKGISLAVHYRQSPQKAEARRRILAAARTSRDVRVFGGKQVVNLVPDDAPHKGDALAAERDRLGCNWVLYVGDDENDEDAFALAGNIVPVRIGRKQRSHARYYLRTQTEIDDLLDLLVRLRNGVALHEPCTPSPSSQRRDNGAARRIRRRENRLAVREHPVYVFQILPRELRFFDVAVQIEHRLKMFARRGQRFEAAGLRRLPRVAQRQRVVRVRILRIVRQRLLAVRDRQLEMRLLALGIAQPEIGQAAQVAPGIGLRRALLLAEPTRNPTT